MYAPQSYSPSMAAPSKLTNSTGNRSNATTAANTPIGQQHMSSLPSIQSQQSSHSNPSTTDDSGFSAQLSDGKA